MRKLIKNITDRYKHAKMKNQLIIMYFAAVFVPILLVGIILVAGNAKRLVTYHSDLLKANNNRIRSVLYEITSQIYSISEEIAFNNDLVEVLSMEYPDERAFKSEADKLGPLEYYQNNYSGISGVEIYTSQRGVQNYRNFRPITDDVVMSEWYKTASDQYSVFWDSVEREDTGGNKYRGLALVRKITLYDSDTEAILLIHVSDNYLKSRIEDNEEDVLLALENKNVFYSNERDNEGRSDLLNVIEGGDEYFSYEGDMEYRGAMNMTYISTLSMKQSDSLMYIVTISNSAYNSVQQIVMITVLIIALAVILPAVLMRFFIMGFSSQVGRMRDEMYSASQGDYDSMEDFDGCYELTAAYKDLWIMLDKIKEKDAAMYAKEINEQKLLNEQQKMEFQMLASQINPHFFCMRSITGNWSKSGITYGPKRKRMILKCSFTGSMSALWKKQGRWHRNFRRWDRAGRAPGFVTAIITSTIFCFPKPESALSILNAFPTRYRSVIWQIICGKCWKKTTGTPDLAWISSVRMTVCAG